MFTTVSKSGYREFRHGSILIQCVRIQASLIAAVRGHARALLFQGPSPRGIYKPAVQRKGNEADCQENDKSTSHIASLPVNEKNCV